MIVAQLTLTQKEQLVGQLFAENCFFNTIQDGNGDWIISVEEVNNCVVEEFMWVTTLPLVEFIPPADPFDRPLI